MTSMAALAVRVCPLPDGCVCVGCQGSVSVCRMCVCVGVCIRVFCIRQSQSNALALAHSCVLSASVTQGAYPVHNIDWVYGVLASKGASSAE